PLARAHFIVRTTPGAVPDVDVKRIEALIAEAARDWSDHLRDELIRHRGEDQGLELFRLFRDGFPSAYRERFTANEALEDIDRIERLIESRELDIELYQQISEEDGGAMELRCKFLHVGTPLALSDVVPRLENMGLRVKMAVPYEVRLAGLDEPIRIRDFALEAPNMSIDLPAVSAKFEQAFLRTWYGDAEDDGFNRLVLCAGLEWYEIVILRVYCKYLRQIGISFSEATMQQALANQPGITRMLLDLFDLQFNPVHSNQQRSAAKGFQEEIERALDDVSSVDEDRVLRAYLNLLEASLRTNYYQQLDGRRKPWLSIKFDSRAVKDLPAPRPLFEIFVYSPRFEAIHLRGGKVARGGLRWSDRREDFRTEVLGLVKAQMVKNAVIVPVGSKGGFVLKQAPPPSQREEFRAEGVDCYRNFLRGLLDLTDNRKDGQVVPPPDVVRRDGDDTYLVVAADKGTATFSDYANGVSAEYGFWLGDAFASGGSAGYDHKKMGITARGAWEAVKRHFRELGMNIQTQDFSVVGVGDMSGDVFGNGMLLSDHIRLIGAFNHVHIFLDPEPDPAASANERRRLFELPRSTWMDYDRTLLSAGGGIYERQAKSITISEEARLRLDLPSRTATPADVIRALRRARSDLLWLGGIGTYVKASDETHADALDRTNDAVRVDATELRSRVVGEGANLGFTQRARIEFALAGGKINTDAIDNSAGVDTSDHEVNIKILLDDAIRRGVLPSVGQRNELLAEMTDEVARLVLRDNYQQTQAISVAESQGVTILDQQARLMRRLERTGRLDRKLESLPDEETIAERNAAHLGLTRPELAVLLAYGKIAVYQELLESDLPDDPLLVEDLFLYFPHRLRDGYADLIPLHRLRREIVATYVTNSMVNRVGPSFVSQMFEETGRSTSDIARAYTISRDSFELRSIWSEVEALDGQVSTTLQTGMMIEVGRLVERATRWFLRCGETLDISANYERFHPGIKELEQNLESVLPPEDLEKLERSRHDRQSLGITQTLARRMAGLDISGSFLDIVRISNSTGRDVKEVGRLYFTIGTRFDLERLRTQASLMVADTPWQRAALVGIIDDLFGYQSTLVSRILGEKGGAPVEAMEQWLETRRDLLERTDRMLSEVRGAPSVDLAVLEVASRQFRSLAR
ncbi:MAG TPA: NAD-glutamate dehydrogenase, partial [Thermoanaerobaculia bacterium]|nr:NAD-glutamate dehydrogenase [Thermoanaerobaculia bacterium]